MASFGAGPAAAPALGTYIGMGIVANGVEHTYSLHLQQKQEFVMDFTKRTSRNAEPISWRASGFYTVFVRDDTGQVMVRCINGSADKERAGDVYEFEVRDGAMGARCLLREGVYLQPQSDTFESPVHQTPRSQGTERKLCSTCNMDIIGQVLKTGNCYFHPGCFTCSSCQRPLTGKFHKQADGKRLCQDCMPKTYCDSCKKVIQGTATKVGGANFHPDCFTCEGCQQRLVGGFINVTKGGSLLRFCTQDCLEATGGRKRVQTEPAQVTPKSTPILSARGSLTSSPTAFAEYQKEREKRNSQSEVQREISRKLDSKELAGEVNVSDKAKMWANRNETPVTRRPSFSVSIQPSSYAAPPGGQMVSPRHSARGASYSVPSGAATPGVGGGGGGAMDKVAAGRCAAVEEDEVPPGCFSLADLQNAAVWKVQGVDAAKRETFLSDATFYKLFGMTKVAFAALPKWKRDKVKQTYDLF
eukprot:TRINITY_DN48302_c0_g1_i1.p1 TRINITY_DN48302_c0_g1~~TRINITY_DN48302_c0_g1_i1.p1  ORF type:complete len:513 (-),score=76.64 TRINITY_DN48302_c0_g1_i1:114-1529(-)